MVHQERQLLAHHPVVSYWIRSRNLHTRLTRAAMLCMTVTVICTHLAAFCLPSGRRLATCLPIFLTPSARQPRRLTGVAAATLHLQGRR